MKICWVVITQSFWHTDRQRALHNFGRGFSGWSLLYNDSKQRILKEYRMMYVRHQLAFVL